jgi:hypothetical protein
MAARTVAVLIMSYYFALKIEVIEKSGEVTGHSQKIAPGLEAFNHV